MQRPFAQAADGGRSPRSHRLRRTGRYPISLSPATTDFPAYFAGA